jgi:hypothetical protein
MERCSRCGETKPYSEFHRNKRGDGYQRWCKTCRKTYDHDYHGRDRVAGNCGRTHSKH